MDIAATSIAPLLRALKRIIPHSSVAGRLLMVMSWSLGMTPAASGSAQDPWPCPNVPIGGNTTTIDGFLLADGYCTMPGDPPQMTDNWISRDGGYIKTGTLLKLHTTATTSGECLWRDFDTWLKTGKCVPKDVNDLRTINHVKIYETPPTWVQTVMSTWAIDGQGSIEWRQQLDTQQVGTTQPNPWTSTPLGDIGTWNYGFKSLVNQTNCTIAPAESQLITRPVNVVSCLPTFKPSSIKLPTDAPITISMSSQYTELKDAADTAGASWTNLLKPYGVNVQFSTTTTGCIPLDAHCIQVEVQFPPIQPNACGETHSHAGADGVMDERAEMYIPPGHTSWDERYRNYVMAHEIAHLLGLDEQAINCIAGGAGDSIMNYPRKTPCGEWVTDIREAPSASDVQAVVRSMYGTTPKKTCG